MANTPEDVWAQVYFLDGGEALGSSLKDFFEKFGISKKPHKESVINDRGLALLRDCLQPFSIRRLKDDVLELPEKRYETITVDLEPDQRQRYDELREKLRLWIVQMDGKAVEDDARNILKRLLRLIQISSNPSLIDSSYVKTPAKVATIQELVSQILSNNEKAVIWTSFVGNIRMLRRLFRDVGAAMLFGDVPIAERDQIVQKFQEEVGIRVLVANPAAPLMVF